MRLEVGNKSLFQISLASLFESDLLLNFLSTGDLLNNYCKIDPVANATRFFFACVVMLTYPIECFVAREVKINGMCMLS